jgi:sterol desaturase/sphingolipid hydroxylase (fatty acid hydroxylase superfamily)
MCATALTATTHAFILSPTRLTAARRISLAGASESKFAKRWRRTKEQVMSLGTILLIVLILILVGALPTWPHARSWGYGPSGIVGVILIIVIVLFLMGRL